MLKRLFSAAPLAVAIATVIGAIAPLASASAAPAPPAPPVGSVGVRRIDAPVDAANDPRARQYIVDHLPPGKVIHRHIEVSNTTRHVLHVSLYTEAANIAAGAFVGAGEHTANELSGWTSLSDSSLDIKAGGTAKDTVTIAVPADAPAGERYAAVWAEVSSPGTGNVTLLNRTGIRMYLSVGAGNPPASNFVVDTMTAARTPNGLPTVQAQVHNTGGRAVDLTGTLELKETSGTLRAGPYDAALGTTLAPGQTETVTIAPKDRLANGPWDADLTLTSGTINGDFKAPLTFPDSGVGPPVVPESNNLFSLVVVLAGLAVAAALMVGGWFLLNRRRRRENPEPELQSANR